MNFEVTEIESQFHDGVYLIMLMGLLEGFFVPHYSFHLTPHEFDQKVHNVTFAFELMEEVGLQKPKARPEGNFLFSFCLDFKMAEIKSLFFFQMLSIWI